MVLYITIQHTHPWLICFPPENSTIFLYSYILFLAEKHPSYYSEVFHALQTEIIFITMFSGNVVQNLHERDLVPHAIHHTYSFGISTVQKFNWPLKAKVVGMKMFKLLFDIYKLFCPATITFDTFNLITDRSCLCHIAKLQSPWQLLCYINYSLILQKINYSWLVWFHTITTSYM